MGNDSSMGNGNGTGGRGRRVGAHSISGAGGGRRGNSGRRRAHSAGDSMFLLCNGALLTLFAAVVLYPFIYILSCSFSSGDALVKGAVWLLPKNPSLEGYRLVFSYTPIWNGYLNSFIYAAAGTALNVLLTVIAAYPLSRRDLPGRKCIMLYFMIPMLFSGGLIPSYMLVQRLGLLNRPLAIILPGAMSVFNVIVMRTFFQGNIPHELLEAAKIDGCGDFRFLASIAIPLSGAIIAVVALWVAVASWNSYFSALIYINDRRLYPLQIVLRELLIATTSIDFTSTNIDPRQLERSQYLSHLLRYGTIIIGSLPLMILYPFVQKYFVKGVMIGSVKG
jgi:multiple sugar transport system permease protein/putative aldouronate transport system permease protein